MATPEINENCHYVQNDLYRCKIELENLHFDILCCCRVIKKSLSGGGAPNPPLLCKIGLNFFLDFTQKEIIWDRNVQKKGF